MTKPDENLLDMRNIQQNVPNFILKVGLQNTLDKRTTSYLDTIGRLSKSDM